MNHLILGYGYSAKYLSQYLLSQGHRVIAYSRTKDQDMPKGLRHAVVDLKSTPLPLQKDVILYYFIPPSDPQDQLLQHILSQLKIPPLKIVYCGSSGIYGDHQGQKVDESSYCHIQSPRQIARQSAENLIEHFASAHQLPFVLSRVAGIYGPKRLPINAVLSQEPVVKPSQAPLSNHIWVQDLAFILGLLGTKLDYSGILNIADGHPLPMGQMQQQLAQILKQPLAPEADFSSVYNHSSPMKQEFLTQSKHLVIQRLKTLLQPFSYQLSSLEQGLLASRELSL